MRSRLGFGSWSGFSCSNTGPHWPAVSCGSAAPRRTDGHPLGSRPEHGREGGMARCYSQTASWAVICEIKKVLIKSAFRSFPLITRHNITTWHFKKPRSFKYHHSGNVSGVQRSSALVKTATSTAVIWTQRH